MDGRVGNSAEKNSRPRLLHYQARTSWHCEWSLPSTLLYFSLCWNELRLMIKTKSQWWSRWSITSVYQFFSDQVHGVELDTSFFTGNFTPRASVQVRQKKAGSFSNSMKFYNLCFSRAPVFRRVPLFSRERYLMWLLFVHLDISAP